MIPNYYVVVPELSFFGDGYFSYVLDGRILSLSGEGLVTFREGDFESALPFMESGCGVLVAPLVAAKNNVKLYETFEVNGAKGPVTCTVAGIVQSAAGASIIGAAAADDFGVTQPMMVNVIPHAGVEATTLQADLLALRSQYPYIQTMTLTLLATVQEDGMGYIVIALNGVLLLTVLAAALGVVNTTMMSIAERRRELGLLRATGATRTQVRNVVVGEAALMGMIGGSFGFAAGIGFVVLFVFTCGGNSRGISVNLVQAAWDSVQPALVIGISGLILAPLIASLAAWLPLRGLLKEAPVAILADRLG